MEDVPGVNCQERTREELIETLRVTLYEALEVNRADSRLAAATGFEEVRLAVSRRLRDTRGVGDGDATSLQY